MLAAFFLGLILSLCTATPVRAATYSFQNQPFAWDAPSGTATTINPWTGACTNYPGGDDDYSVVNFPAGFSFNFAGVNYSQVTVFSNGMMEFGPLTGFWTQYTNATLPINAVSNQTPAGCTNTVPGNLLLPYWIDINTLPNIAAAPVQYELLGTAPNQRFVVTWNNVALYGSNATRYSFQVVLRESPSGVNGNFEYRYTTGASTGNPATVGVQVSTTDSTLYSYNSAFIDTTSGTNILWYPQSTLAAATSYYQFNQASWNGTPGEIVDSSGNGNNGVRVGAAQTSAITKCGTGRSASIPSNTSATTIDAVSSPVIPGATGSVDFWFYSNSAWNNAAATLFDATTTVTRPFYFEKLATGALKFVVSDSNGNTVTATTGALGFAAASWQHVGVSWVVLPGTNQTFLQIFVNGAVSASARGTTIGTIATLGNLYFGDNRTSGVTPAGGTVNSANGLIDEVKTYTTQINAYQTAQDQACQTLQHVKVQSSGTGLTCAPSTLTLSAWQDAAETSAYTLGVSGTMTVGGAPTVTWDGTTGGAGGAGFVIAAGASSVTKNVQVSTAGTVLLSAAFLAPSASSASTCNFGTPSCTFTSNAAGFVLSNSATGNTYTVPPQTAGIATGTLYLRALRASTTNPAVCTPAIASSTTAVNMSYTCNNPTTCSAANLVTVNATPIAGNPNATPTASSTSVNLSFDANASAPVTLRYDDVGQITINASKTITPPNGSAATLTGSSNAYVVAPHHFTLSGVTTGPIRAGTPFSATVTAYNGLAAPAATANFGKETAPESVAISMTRFQPTGPGAVNGSLSGGAGSFSGGAATAANLAWSEVGKLDLIATLASASYLGSGLSAVGSTGNSGAVGPFIPDHFVTVVTQACSAGGYSYSAQPFTLQVWAMNGAATPAVTQNYDGTTATSPNFANSVALSDATGATAGTLAPATVAATLFTAGKAGTPTALSPTYTFASRSTAPTPITLRAAYSNATPAYIVTSSGFTEGSTTVRSGRGRLLNGNGSELLDLQVPFRAEYYQSAAQGWQLNSADVCTNASVTITSGTLAAGKTCVQDSGSPGNSGGGCAAPGPTAPTDERFREAGVAAFAGDFNLWLRAPGSGNTGTVTLTGVVPAWLQYPWTSATPTSPTTRATFGVTKSGPVIHRREMY